MTPERWGRIKEILGEALELEPGQRTAFVQSAAQGDPGLLAEVNRLVAESDQGSGPFSKPAILLPRPISTAVERRFPEDSLLAKRFQIVRFIACGGMGEVYEAEDIELRERIALKTIRRRGADGGELLALFKNEVQLARRVTHPNVCRIYDLAQHQDPVSGERTMLLSMELLHGQTLAEYLKQHGPLNWRTALPLIEQIGAGIQAAHEAGIIHGDLKPANVMLSRTEDLSRTRAVVMDFGVAMPAEQAPAGTSRGGTPGYLAPEQLDGRPLSPATDVYAFGVLVAEMLGAGRPDAFQPNRAQLPPAWARALQRCFEAEPAGRLQTAAGLVRLLQPPERFPWKRALQAAAIFIVVSLGVVAARHSWMTANPMLQQVFTESTGEYTWSVSPDGKWIAETMWDTGDLAIRDTASGHVRRLTHNAGDSGAWGAVFSPDSRNLVYRWNHSRTEGDVRVIGVDGKNERILTTAGATPLDWSSDGQLVLAELARHSLGLISATSGSIQTIPSVQTAANARALFNPEGTGIVLDVPQRDPKERLFDIHFVRFDGKESSLIDHPANDVLVGWAPDGKRLIFSSDRSGKYSLWAATVSRGAIAGEPQELRPGAGELEPLGITRAGSLYYRLEAQSAVIQTAALDIAGGRTVEAPKPLPTRFNGPYMYPNWSESGARLVFSSLQDLRHPELGIYTVADGSVRLLPVGLTIVTRAQWYRHDTSLVAVGVARDRQQGQFRIDPRTGDASLITPEQTIQSGFEGVWTPDGLTLYDRFTDWQRGLFRFHLPTGTKKVLYVPSAGIDIATENLALSPDGRTLAFHARNDRAGTASLMLVPTEGGEARTLWTVKRPDRFEYGSFTWTGDSKNVLAARTREESSEIWRIPVDGSPPGQIAFPKIRIHSLRLNPDGRTIAFASVKHRNEIWVFQRFLR